MEFHHVPSFVPFFWGLFALVIVITALWLRHKRHMATLEVLKMYVAQGKEPPVEMFHSFRDARRAEWHGAQWRWRRAIFFGSLAIGFLAAHFVTLDYSPYHYGPGLLIPAVILGCLALGQVLLALLYGRTDKQQ